MNKNGFDFKMEKDEEVDAIGLLSQNLDVDLIVDLEDLSIIEAVAKTEDALKNSKVNKIWFKFPLANQSGNHTLFHPIGSYLRDKLKAREIVRAMPAQTGGWIARLR